jgi:hypothetical protein
MLPNPTKLQPKNAVPVFNSYFANAIPKIVAERDSDIPDVFDRAAKVEDCNLQNLRQIGMNYDIANAKGIVQLSLEVKKREEHKKKATEERKRTLRRRRLSSKE